MGTRVIWDTNNHSKNITKTSLKTIKCLFAINSPTVPRVQSIVWETLGIKNKWNVSKNTDLKCLETELNPLLKSQCLCVTSESSDNYLFKLAKILKIVNCL